MSSAQPSSTRDKDNEFMSRFSLSLIRKIMLTDPVDFPHLTMNGLPKAKQVFFHEFVQNRSFHFWLERRGGTGAREELEAETTTNSNTIDIEQSIHNLSIHTTPSPSSSSSIEEQISKTMHRAYNDMILNEMEQKHRSYKPLQSIILEIHSMLRSLIPNRPDLHSYLKDEHVINCQLDSFQKVANMLKMVGDAVCMLESEYRSESTKQWLQILTFVDGDCDGNDENDNSQTCTTSKEELFIQEKEKRVQITNYSTSSGLGSEVEGAENKTEEEGGKECLYMSYTSFALASTLFLHYKAELCQAETADFQLAHILAPRIHQLGKKFLFEKFQEKFGLASNDDQIESKVKHTKTWIEEMVNESTSSSSSSYTLEELLTSEEKRGHVIVQTGWVDNILFRSPRSIHHEEGGNAENISRPVATSTQFLMPEVLWLDTGSIRDIRMTTKISVVGSVLALHAATAAGVSDSVFKRNPIDSIIDHSRVKLTAAMKNRHVGSQDIYEKEIADAVLELSKALNPDMINSQSAQESLKNRTKATLRGEDPVIKLLDNRMREIFRTLLVSNPMNRQQVPTSIRSGRNLSHSGSMATGSGAGGGTRDMTFNSLFRQAAKQEFVAKGFSFYADELAEASLLACRTINLILSIHGEVPIEKLFTNACRRSA